MRKTLKKKNNESSLGILYKVKDFQRLAHNKIDWTLYLSHIWILGSIKKLLSWIVISCVLYLVCTSTSSSLYRSKNYDFRSLHLYFIIFVLDNSKGNFCFEDFLCALTSYMIMLDLENFLYLYIFERWSLNLLYFMFDWISHCSTLVFLVSAVKGNFIFNLFCVSLVLKIFLETIWKWLTLIFNIKIIGSTQNHIPIHSKSIPDLLEPLFQKHYMFWINYKRWKASKFILDLIHQKKNLKLNQICLCFCFSKAFLFNSAFFKTF